MVEALAGQLNLSVDDLRETLSSGQAKFYNRTSWVKFYFGKAGLLDFPSRAKFRITNRGMDLLKTNPETIRIKTLNQFPEFAEFRNKSADVEDEPRILNTSQGEGESATPEERLEDGYQELRDQLASDLLEAILKPPKLF